MVTEMPSVNNGQLQGLFMTSISLRSQLKRMLGLNRDQFSKLVKKNPYVPFFPLCFVGIKSGNKYSYQGLLYMTIGSTVAPQVLGKSCFSICSK